MREKEAQESKVMKMGSISLLFILGLFAAFYYLILMPMKQKDDTKEL